MLASPKSISENSPDRTAATSRESSIRRAQEGYRGRRLDISFHASNLLHGYLLPRCAATRHFAGAQLSTSSASHTSVACTPQLLRHIPVQFSRTHGEIPRGFGAQSTHVRVFHVVIISELCSAEDHMPTTKISTPAMGNITTSRDQVADFPTPYVYLSFAEHMARNTANPPARSIRVSYGRPLSGE
jgi:hypothetical protein